MSTKTLRKRILKGVVTSTKSEKTLVVDVIKRLPHSLYKKFIIKRKKYKVHDEEKKAKVGDVVRIIESRPYSKDKRFKLFEIVGREQA